MPASSWNSCKVAVVPDSIAHGVLGPAQINLGPDRERSALGRAHLVLTGADPSYVPLKTDLARRASTETYLSLLSQAYHPQFNRPTSQTYSEHRPKVPTALPAKKCHMAFKTNKVILSIILS